MTLLVILILSILDMKNKPFLTAFYVLKRMMFLFLTEKNLCFLDLRSLSLTIPGLMPVSPHLSLIYTSDLRERFGFIDGVPAHMEFFGSWGNKPEAMLAFGTKIS